MNNTNTVTLTVKIERVQHLRAMERLMIALDGKDGMMAWLNAMPDDVILGSNGFTGQKSLEGIAANDSDYNSIVHAFAEHMVPVLQKIANEEVCCDE